MYFIEETTNNIVEIEDTLEVIELENGSTDSIVVVTVLSTTEVYTCLRSTLTPVTEAEEVYPTHVMSSTLELVASKLV